MLRQALAADEAQTLFTLSAFFIGFGVGQLLLGPLHKRYPTEVASAFSIVGRRATVAHRAEFGLQLAVRTRQLRASGVDKVEALREIGHAVGRG